MPLKPCPRCGRMIQYGPTYCQACQPIVASEKAEAQERKAALRKSKYNKEYNKRRDPERMAFYRSKAWRMTSKAKLQDCMYRCEARLDDECKRTPRLACEVHHIKPIRTPEGWDQRLEWSNLMGVCVQCHNILDNKTFKRKGDEYVVDLKAGTS